MAQKPLGKGKKVAKPGKQPSVKRVVEAAKKTKRGETCGKGGPGWKGKEHEVSPGQSPDAVLVPWESWCGPPAHHMHACPVQARCRRHPSGRP